MNTHNTNTMNTEIWNNLAVKAHTLADLIIDAIRQASATGRIEYDAAVEEYQDALEQLHGLEHTLAVAQHLHLVADLDTGRTAPQEEGRQK